MAESSRRHIVCPATTERADGRRRTYGTTYVHRWSTLWCERTRAYDSRQGRARALIGLLRSHGPAILHGAAGFDRGYVDLIAAAALGRGVGPVLLAEATWEPGTRSIDRVLGRAPSFGYDPPPRFGRRGARALIGLVDSQHVHYAVLSSDEVALFPETWGIDGRRVHFTPFCATAKDLTEARGGSGVFASGNSLRDYRGLIEAAPSITAPVTIASSLAFRDRRLRNLSIGYFSAAEHEARMRAAAVVVVPLLPGTRRSGGQQTYLNAMACGKAVVVTDAPGVRDYVQDGHTGVVAPNDAESLATAVNGVLADPAEARRIGANARSEVMERFTPRHYVERLIELADRL